MARHAQHVGHGGSQRQGNHCRVGKKITKNSYTFNILVIKNDIVDCSKAATLFEKSLRSLLAYLHCEGEKETVVLAQALEDQNNPVITIILAMPLMIPDPNMTPEPNARGVQQAPLIEDRGSMLLLEGTMKHIPGRQAKLANGLVSAYATLWDQCIPTLKSKLEQLAGYNQINQDKNPLHLFKEMRNIICRHDAHQEPIYSMVHMLKGQLAIMQEPNKLNEEFKGSLRAFGMYSTSKAAKPPTTPA